jgi:hypothetical protein
VLNILGCCREPTLNNNGRKLIEFTTYNRLKITNTFFRKKLNNKFTWAARGLRSLIDYTLVNEKAGPLIQDVHVYRGENINRSLFVKDKNNIVCTMEEKENNKQKYRKVNYA